MHLPSSQKGVADFAFDSKYLSVILSQRLSKTDTLDNGNTDSTDYKLYPGSLQIHEFVNQQFDDLARANVYF